MKKTPPLLALAALLLVAGPAAHGQSLYGTNFDGTTTFPYNDPTVYTQGADLVGQGVTGQVWTGNDDESGGTQEGTTGNYTGGLNQVLASGVSTGSGGALLGGVSSGTASGNVYPGVASVYVAHPFTLGTPKSLTLNTDYSISASTTAYSSSFGFGFLNSSNTNVISVRFVPDANKAGQDDVEYQIGVGAFVNSGTSAIILGSIYHLALTVNVTNNTFTIATGGLTPYSNISLGTTSASTVTQVAAFQAVIDTTKDSFGGYTHDGNDQLGFDNLNITVAPEPSTYVITGIGLLGLLGLMKFRRVV